MSQPDVLVIGGGIIGAACARALALRDLKVAIVEAGPKSGAATLAAAGMLAPLAEAKPEDPLLGFAVRARDLYRELAPLLEDETGINIGLWTDGVLQIAFTEEEVNLGKSDVAWQRQSGFAANWLTPEDLQQLVPGIAEDALGATMAPEDGALQTLQLLDALIKSAQQHGATLTRGESVEELIIRDGRAEGVRTSGQTLHAGAVLVAAGAWSGKLRGLPRPLSVEPIRGQLAAFAWPAEEPPRIVYGAGGYVLERNGAAVAGSTMEYVGFDHSVTEAGLNKIATSLGRIYPKLKDAPVQKTWSGFRPGTPDGRPFIGPDPDVKRLWYATGHGRNGVLFAGATGELIAQLYAGEEVEQEVTALDPARFWKI